MRVTVEDVGEVDLQFCPVFTMMYWTTLPVLPISIFALSWSDKLTIKCNE